MKPTRVQIVLPSTYDNKWLLRVIHSLDEMDIEVEFVNRPVYQYTWPTTWQVNPSKPYVTYNSNNSNKISAAQLDLFDKVGQPDDKS